MTRQIKFRAWDGNTMTQQPESKGTEEWRAEFEREFSEDEGFLWRDKFPKAKNLIMFGQRHVPVSKDYLESFIFSLLASAHLEADQRVREAVETERQEIHRRLEKFTEHHTMTRSLLDNFSDLVE